MAQMQHTEGRIEVSFRHPSDELAEHVLGGLGATSTFTLNGLTFDVLVTKVERDEQWGGLMISLSGHVTPARKG